MLKRAKRGRDNGSCFCDACNWVVISSLPESLKKEIKAKLIEAANDQNGFYENGHGIDETIKMLELKLKAANDDSFNSEPPESLTAAQLTDKVSDGQIFGVSFIKRTTGELRTMACRLGVKKFLRGGKMAYSPTERQLLTVFSMNYNGYRMIPLEGIQSLTVAGKHYSLEVAA